jgi:hypothetical protein
MSVLLLAMVVASWGGAPSQRVAEGQDGGDGSSNGRGGGPPDGDGTETMTIEEISEEVVTRKLDAIRTAQGDMSVAVGNLKHAVPDTGDISSSVRATKEEIEGIWFETDGKLRDAEEFAKNELKKIVQADPSKTRDVSKAQTDIIKALDQAHVENRALSDFYSASAEQLVKS